LLKPQESKTVLRIFLEAFGKRTCRHDGMKPSPWFQRQNFVISTNRHRQNLQESDSSLFFKQSADGACSHSSWMAQMSTFPFPSGN